MILSRYGTLHSTSQHLRTKDSGLTTLWLVRHEINLLFRRAIAVLCAIIHAPLILQALVDMSAMPGVHELCEMLDTKTIPR